MLSNALIVMNAHVEKHFLSHTTTFNAICYSGWKAAHSHAYTDDIFSAVVQLKLQCIAVPILMSFGMAINSGAKRRNIIITIIIIIYCTQ